MRTRKKERRKIISTFVARMKLLPVLKLSLSATRSSMVLSYEEG
jgi:hypothetical protein